MFITKGTKGRSIGRYRYLVIWVVWLALFVGAFDRSNVSLLLVDPAFLRDMGLEGSPEKQGLVMTMLLLPYALSNVLLSPAADRWGPRRVLTLMAGLWSLVSLFLGSVTSYPALLAGRVARGTAEGPLFPLANRYVRNWFPPSERGIANALWTCGQRVGLALSVPLLTLVIAGLGWRYSFYLQAIGIALLLVPAVWFWAGDHPETTERVGQAEWDHIGGALPSGKDSSSTAGHDLPSLLKNWRYWLAVTHHFAVLAVYFGLVTWLPKYLRDARGFDVAEMVLFATLPHLCSTVTGVGVGIVSDRLGRRAVFCAAGLAGASAAVTFAAFAPDPTVSALLMVLGFGVWGLAPPAYYAVMQRLVPSSIMATGIGIDNGLSNLGSAMAPVAVGLLIGSTGSYLAGLLFLAAVGVAGSVAAAVLAAKSY